MEGEGQTKSGTADAPSPDPYHDHESQDDLPPEEKGNFYLFHTVVKVHLLKKSNVK